MNTTANYNLYKPESNEQFDISTFNANVDNLDTLLKDKIDATALMQTLLTLVYPVGSVYITINNINPQTYLTGTVWESIGSGRCLWGADANHNGGTTIAAGIPNIIGTYDGGHTVSGAFITSPNSEKNGFNTTGHTDIRTHSFDARNGETKTDGTLKTDEAEKVYGNSDTVQPPAYCVYMWKRVS